MDGTSQAPQKEKLEQLKKILPEAFSEGKIDWEKLKATLGEDINFSNERYVLNWAGKSEAFKALQSPTSKTLTPAKEESVNFEDTQNIFIEGENLEVLKILQKSYFGKVKMIYIDPPYNTGNDSFIYPDKFSETKQDYQKRVGDKDEEGYMTREGNYAKNSKENGQYHSNWLNMMYPRLFLAKNLLKKDGVIFVSIDDNEVHNLRLLMNEIFGEENFLGMFVVNSSPSAIDYGHVGTMHEYALFYSRNFEKTTTNQLTEKEKKFKYEDEVGPFNIYPLYNGNVAFNPQTRPNLHYPFYLNPEKVIQNEFYEIDLKPHNGWVEVFPVVSNKDNISRVWRWGRQKSSKHLNEEIIGYKTGAGEYRIVQKSRHTSKMIRSLQLDTLISSRKGTAEVQELFGSKVFSFPKSVELLKRFVLAGSNDGDVILDFFSGSASLAQAVLDVNHDENTNRKYLCVQLPEKTAEQSEAYKAGYKTIADIAKERIRRAGKKIENEIKAEKEKKKGELGFEEEGTTSSLPDLGFKVLKLADSNFKQWQQIKNKDAAALEEQMKLFLDPVREKATTQNMVYELLLKSGKDLNSSIEDKKGYTSINQGELILVLEEANQDIFTSILAENPQKVIALDKLFKRNDQLKTNTALQMKDAGIEFKTI